MKFIFCFSDEKLYGLIGVAKTPLRIDDGRQVKGHIGA